MSARQHRRPVGRQLGHQHEPRKEESRNGSRTQCSLGRLEAIPDARRDILLGSYLASSLSRAAVRELGASGCL